MSYSATKGVSDSLTPFPYRTLKWWEWNEKTKGWDKMLGGPGFDTGNRKLLAISPSGQAIVYEPDDNI